MPATCKFEVIAEKSLDFRGPTTTTLLPKSYQAFDIFFTPHDLEPIRYQMNFSTLHNPYEQHKIIIAGEGYQESLTFEELPQDCEGEVRFGDAIVNQWKGVSIRLRNNSGKALSFNWQIPEAEHGEFKFRPQAGLIDAKADKEVRVSFRSETACETATALTCEYSAITPAETGFEEWDDTFTTVRLVRPSEYEQIALARKRKLELEAEPATGKKKGAEDDIEEPEPIEVDMSEEANIELHEKVDPPAFTIEEGSEKSAELQASVTVDLASYECSVKEILFKPTLMFSSRVFKFSLRNTSKIRLNYLFKFTDAQRGLPDNGAFSISPTSGAVSPGCDE